MPAGYETFKSFMKYQNCWMKQSWNLIIIIIIIIIFFFFFFEKSELKTKKLRPYLVFSVKNVQH